MRHASWALTAGLVARQFQSAPNALAKALAKTSCVCVNVKFSLCQFPSLILFHQQLLKKLRKICLCQLGWLVTLGNLSVLGYRCGGRHLTAGRLKAAFVTWTFWMHPRRRPRGEVEEAWWQPSQGAPPHPARLRTGSSSFHSHVPLIYVPPFNLSTDWWIYSETRSSVDQSR